MSSISKCDDNDKVIKLENKISIALSKLSDIDDQFNSKFNEIDSSMSKTIRQLSSIDTLVKESNIKYPDIDAKYDQLTKKYNDLIKTIKSVVLNIEVSNSKLKDNTISKLDKSNQRVASLELSVNDVSNKIDDASSELAKMQKTIKLIFSSLNKIEENYKTKLADIRSKLDKSSKKIPKLDLKIGLLYHNDIDLEEIQIDQSNAVKKLDKKLKEFRDQLQSI